MSYIKVAVIMAGGRGTRLWPLSTPEHPKQFIKLSGDRTLLQQSIDRLLPEYMPENIFIVTNASYKSLVKNQAPEIPDHNVFYEPCGRNTAPCIALISFIIKKRYDSDTIVSIFPSDHIIHDLSNFRETLVYANEQAFSTRSILTLGIQPTIPHSGYGYIQCELDEKDNDFLKCLPVKRFIEKPDIETAKSYVAQKNFFWNAGMFVWHNDVILDELEHHLKSVFDLLAPLGSLSNSEEQPFIDDHFQDAQAISIDYAICEKSKRVRCIPSDFGWNDIGGWSALEEITPAKNNNTGYYQRLEQIDSRGNILHTPKLKVGLLGVENLTIVQSGDYLLICPKDRSEEIKALSNKFT